ncbi:COG4223 family protein, partial [Leisingera sp. ANG-Vp]|uniref:COG4223 family protein n=1 Tax=Leisingera sp. ANG-Vp TaxID=1577896 RepID=UPI00057F0FF6
ETETETEVAAAEDAAVEEALADLAETGVAAEPAREVERIVEKRGGFGSAVLGGAVAAVIGFVAGQGGWLDSVLPAGLKGSSVDLTALETGQSDLEAAVAALKQQVEANQAPDLAPLTARVDALAGEIEPLKSAQAPDEALQSGLDALAARVAALETRPLEGASPEAVAAFEAELNKLQDSLAAQRSEVEQMLAEAQAMDAASTEAARIASAQTQLALLRSALDSGNSYAANAQELAGLGVDLPAALSGPAESGVATLSALRDGFAPAAREALASAREETKEGGSLLDYVNRHLGARSVEPREGDDPDAVLSRAEAAVAAGKVQDALDEIAALPEAARMALSSWEAAANARMAAVTAAADLAQSLQAK